MPPGPHFQPLLAGLRLAALGMRLTALGLLLTVLACARPRPESPDVASAPDAVGVADLPPGPEVQADTPETAGQPPDGGAPEDQAGAGPCTTFAEPTPTGLLQDPGLAELSGIVPSHAHPGLLWVHNDSGNPPDLFAIEPGGAVRGRYRLQGLPAEDWEDVALGPCPPGGPARCLTLADTGDNLLKRKEVYLLRLPEPTLPPAGVTLVVLGPQDVEVTAFSWPDGPHDVEALVAEADGRMVLLDKRKDGTTLVFRVDPQQPAPRQAVALGSLDLRTPAMKDGLPLSVTAADLAGGRLIVRTYLTVQVFEVGPSLSLQAPARWLLDPAFELQGEAIAWDPAGGWWQVSEGPGAEVWRVNCQP